MFVRLRLQRFLNVIDLSVLIIVSINNGTAPIVSDA